MLVNIFDEVWWLQTWQNYRCTFQPFACCSYTFPLLLLHHHICGPEIQEMCWDPWQELHLRLKLAYHLDVFERERVWKPGVKSGYLTFYFLDLDFDFLYFEGAGKGRGVGLYSPNPTDSSNEADNTWPISFLIGCSFAKSPSKENIGRTPRTYLKTTTSQYWNPSQRIPRGWRHKHPVNPVWPLSVPVIAGVIRLRCSIGIVVVPV